MRNATHTVTSAMGTIMGVAGIEHGIGEILQGSTAAGGLMIQSWPDSAFFRGVGGEPAMTIIPNLLVTGVLAILFSLAFGIWANLFVQRKNGGLVLILLAIGMLLAGGGIFPPVIGIGIGVLATRIQAPLTWWRTHLPASAQDWPGKVWPVAMAACVIAWLLLFPGISLIGYFLGVNDPNLTVGFILLAFGTLLVAIFSGFAYDARGQATQAAK